MEDIYTNITPQKGMPNISHRDTVEILRKRAGLLQGRDRVLMTIYLEKGISFRQMAKLTGVSEGKIARRIRKLAYRLADNRYTMCLRYREQFNSYQLQIARDYFMRGLSMRKIARKRRSNIYRIRKIIIRICNLLRVLEASEASRISA